MKIVHLCTQDYGGAGKAAYRLNLGLNAIGVDSKMIVLGKRSGNFTVKVLPDTNQDSAFNCLDVEMHESKILQAQWNRWASILSAYPNRPKGLELFSDTSAFTKLANCVEIKEADIINMHWVAGIVDYKKMKEAFGDKQIVWTLHDMNAFTGGCHYADDCIKYKSNCENCPQLGALHVDDISQRIWTLKKNVYSNLNINVVTPSKWLANCAKSSRLFSTRKVDVIPYGFPLDNFKPYDTAELRIRHGINSDTKLVLFGAESVTNQRKGFIYLLKALEKIEINSDQKIKLGIFGNLPEEINITSRFETIRFGSVNDEVEIAKIYSVADVFVIPSLEDNLPNTVVESMACGTPVVGFNIGGVPDMVTHLKTGYLAHEKDINDLAAGIKTVLFELDSNELSNNCLKNAKQNYSLTLQAKRYVNLYEELLGNEKSANRWDSDIHTAEQLIESGDYKAAKKILLALLENNSDSVVALNDLAVINIFENNIKKAAEYLNSVLLIDPKNSIAHENYNYIIQNCSGHNNTTEFKFPKITIVTPSFNQAKYLEECILSVISQGYPNLEYIIMDGGSTDGSVEIIKKYEKHLTYWQSKPDGGQYAAIQEGLNKGNGEIQGWINSDDRLYPQSLQTIASIFSNEQDVEWITGRPSMFNEHGEQLFRINLPIWSQERYFNKDYKFIQQECTFWKRALWKKAGSKMRSELKLAGDLELWMRFFRYAKLHSIDIFMGGFRKQPEQKTHNLLQQYMIEAEKILDEEIDRINVSSDKLLKGTPAIHLSSNSLIKIENPDRFNELMKMVDDCIDEQKIPEAKKYLNEAISFEPNSIHLLEALSDLEYKSGNISNAKILLWNIISRFDADESIFHKLFSYEMEEFRIDNAINLIYKFDAAFPGNETYTGNIKKLSELHSFCQGLAKANYLFNSGKTSEAALIMQKLSNQLFKYFGEQGINNKTSPILSIQELKELSANATAFIENLEMIDLKNYLNSYAQNKLSKHRIVDEVPTKQVFIDKDKILVSAIVSTYNSEKYIKGCLDDLVNQTIYKSGQLEIVIVNSGSEENEDAIVKEYKSAYPNINYIKTEVRESIYQAWNRGIKAANGEYITNANTDDRHRPDAFEIMLNQFCVDKNRDLVYANVLQTKTPNDTYYSSTQKSALNWIDFDPDLLLFGCFLGPQPMWKKELHTRFGYFDESLKVVGDYEFWLRISREAIIHHINEPLGLYLFADDSAEHRDNSLTAKENLHIQKKYFCEYIKNEEQLEKVLTKLNEINKVFNNQQYYSTGLNFLNARKNGIQVQTKVHDFAINFGVGSNGNTDSLIQELVNQTNAVNIIIDKDLYLGILYGLRGSYFLMIGNLELAKEHFESALNYDAESSEACTGLGEVFYQSNIYDSAKEMFEWAVKLDGNNEFAKEKLLKINRENNMLNTNSEAVNPVHYKKLEQAEEFINAENYSRARSILGEIISEDKKHVDALNDLSVIDILEGNFYGAAEMISKIIDIDPQNEVAIDNLANLEKIVDDNLISIKNNS